jgi:hypothetical protein
MPHRIADADELKKVLASGESETVEFKVTVPPPDVIARNIAAFTGVRGKFMHEALTI